MPVNSTSDHITFGMEFPDASDGDQVEINGDAVIRTSASRRCCVCCDLTFWLSVSFIAYFCSEGCLDRMWKAYYRSLDGYEID